MGVEFAQRLVFPFQSTAMTPELSAKLLAGLKDGSIVPYLGPGVLADVKNAATGAPFPPTAIPSSMP